MLPPRIVLYGPSKIGISSFCSQIPNAYFMDVSGSVGHLDVEADRCKTIDDCNEAIEFLMNGNHNHKVLVIDTLDSLEVMLSNEVFEHEKKKTPLLEYFDEIPYGRGPGMVMSEFRNFLSELDDLCIDRNMTIIICAHESIEQHNLIFGGPMTVSRPSMVTRTVKAQTIAEDASTILTNWADCVLYVAQQNHVGGGFFSKDKQTKLNAHPQERFIYTERRPGFEAGNRYNLPYDIKFEWLSLREELYKLYDKPLTQ